NFLQRDGTRQKKIGHALRSPQFQARLWCQPDELPTVKRETARQLTDVIASLKPMDREVLRLFYYYDASLKEMRTELEVPIGTVKRRLHTARERFINKVPRGLRMELGIGPRLDG